jgi:hypothetical protein
MRRMRAGVKLPIAIRHRLGIGREPVWSKNCNALLRPHLGTSTPSSEG